MEDFSSGLTPDLQGDASDHLFEGRVTRSETQEAEGSEVLPSGADPSTEQSETQCLCSQGAYPSTELQPKGADPRTGTRKGETCCSLVSRPLSALPCLLFVPGAFWSRVAWSPALSRLVPVCVFFGLFWPWASRSSSRMGGTSGQNSFPFLFMGTDPSTGFSRYPFMYVLLEFHFVLELDFLVSSTGYFFFMTAVTGHFVNELFLASTKGSEDTISCLMFQTRALCSRSLS